MIFVTVGAQMQFDRLIRTVDDWAGARGRSDLLAQIGEGLYIPTRIRWERFLDPPAFKSAMAEADAIVSHAGTGTIITALQLGKPILVLPRHADLRETRNDHQIATARRFLARGHVHVAMDEAELIAKLDRLHELAADASIGPEASGELLDALRSFVLKDAA